MKVIISRLIQYFCIGIVLTVFYSRLLRILLEYSVNLVFQDKLLLLYPLYKGESYFKTFFIEHPIGRQGVSAVIERIILEFTSLNTEFVSAFVLLILVVTTLCGLFLMRRFTGKWGIEAAIIPILTLSVSQYEILVVDPYPPAVFALFGLFITGIAFTYKDIRRYVGIIIGSFFTFFSASGFVCWPGIFLLVLIDLYHFRDVSRSVQKAIFVTIAILLSYIPIFLHGFTLNNLLPSEFNLWRIMQFLTMMFVSRIGFINGTENEMLLGALIIAMGLIISGMSIYKYIKTSRNQSVYANSILFISYGLFFGIAATFGRHIMSVHYESSARYIIYTLTVYLGIFFGMLTIRERFFRITCVVLVLLFLGVSDFINEPHYREDLTLITDSKRKWIACYKAHKAVRECSESLDFEIYPITGKMDYNFLVETMIYFEQNKLNLFTYDR